LVECKNDVLGESSCKNISRFGLKNLDSQYLLLMSCEECLAGLNSRGIFFSYSTVRVNSHRGILEISIENEQNMIGKEQNS